MKEKSVSQQSSNGLLKLLGFGFGVAATIGGTIGTGILRKPGPIAAALGDPWIIMGVWIAVSVYAFLGVLCTIELALIVPKAGSWYAYSKRAFGNYIGFLTGITSWFGTVSAIAFGAFTMSEYLVVLFPSFENSIPQIAALILCVLTLFHSLGTKSAGKSQELVTTLKAIALLVFIALCFIYGRGQNHQESISTNLKTYTLVSGLLYALQQVFYTFDGWHTASYFTEETENPKLSLARSMICGVLVVISIYLLVNLAILYVLPIPVLAASKLAAADAIQAMFGKEAARIVTFGLMLSIFGMLNAQIMFAPRVIYAMSKDGLLHSRLQQTNGRGTPLAATILTIVLSIILILSGKEITSRLSDIATFFFVLGYIAGFCALIMLRKVEPNIERPFRVVAYPYVPLVLIIVSILFLTGALIEDFKSGVLALSFLVLSYPVYRVLQQVR